MWVFLQYLTHGLDADLQLVNIKHHRHKFSLEGGWEAAINELQSTDFNESIPNMTNVGHCM